MGVVKRQGAQNLILLVVGATLGALNKVVIFQQVLTEGEYGMIELMITGMIIGAEIGLLGADKITYRFFPRYKNTRQRRSAFNGLIILYGLFGFGVVGIAFALLYPSLKQTFDGTLFADQLHWLIVIMFGQLGYRTGEALSQSNMRSVVPTFGMEILLRLWHLASVIAYSQDWVEFETFVGIYMIGYLVPSTLNFVVLTINRELPVRFDFYLMQRRVLKVLISYGLTTSISLLSYLLVTRVDILMIGAMLGEAQAGGYGFAYYLVILLLIPSKAVNRILAPVISVNFTRGGLDEIESLYRRASATNFLLSQLCFLIVYVSLDPFFILFPKFAEAKSVVILLGIGQLSNAIVGPQRIIIINSPYYRFDLYSNIAMIIVVVVSNYFLIPPFGIRGAAIATAASMLLYNLTGTIFVRWTFKMSPFSLKTLGSMALGTTLAVVGTNLPHLVNPWVDIAYRTGLTVSIYMCVTLILRLSPDFNQVWRSILKRVV